MLAVARELAPAGGRSPPKPGGRDPTQGSGRLSDDRCAAEREPAPSPQKGRVSGGVARANPARNPPAVPLIASLYSWPVKHV